MRPPRYHILAEEGVAAPTAGLDTASADTYVAQNRARVLTNFLPGRAGRLPLRGPVVWSQNLSGLLTLDTSAVTTSAISFVGWTFGDRVLVSDGAGNITTINFSPASAPTTTTPILLAAGIRLPSLLSTDGSYVRLGNYVFGPCWTSAGADAGLLRWDGTGVAGGFTEITNGPKGSKSVAVWLDRVWTLGGTVPGAGGTNFANRLYWTDPEWDGTDVLTAWEDDVSGLVNQIVLNQTNDTPVALAVFNKSLLILMRNSIIAVSGTSPANFSTRVVANVGCVAGGTVVVHDTGVYFLSDHGYVVFDGASVRPVSQMVEDSTFMSIAATNIGALRAHATLIDTHHLALFGPSFTAVLHIPSLSWMTVQLDGVDAAHPGRVGRTINHPFVITHLAGHQRVNLLDHLATPDLAVASGSTFSDFGTVPYGGTIESRIIELGSPEVKANLHRILVDSKPLGTTGFTATIEALDGTVLKTIAIPTSANNWVQRTVADLDGIECDFVRLKWSLTSATGPAEVQDARIEFQHAQGRTG